jgi:hypothetical protein
VTIRAEQSHIVNSVVLEIAINMMDFEWHPVCHRVPLVPAAILALLSAKAYQAAANSWEATI